MDIETVYSEYHDKVFSYIKSKVNRKEDAEDICADVFLKVQKKLSDYDKEKAGVSTWIYTIARNSVIDFYRSNHATEELPDELSEELASDEATDAALLNRETLQELADALLRLSEEEKDVIVLHYYQGLSLTEIEQRTGLSYGQVKLRHNSALKAMKKFLSGKDHGAGFRIV